ncbi:hypothetical protein UU5_01262, partial [Rhodanobacter sp. 115]
MLRGYLKLVNFWTASFGVENSTRCVAKLVKPEKGVKMKLLLKWSAITFLAAAWVPAIAANVQGMNFPKHLATFTLDSVINNERDIPGQGTSLLYDAVGVKASVFVYDLGIKNIESGIDSTTVRDEFLKTSGDVRTVHPDAQNLHSSKHLTVSGISLLHVAFQYVESEPGTRDTVFSNLYITPDSVISPRQ